MSTLIEHQELWHFDHDTVTAGFVIFSYRPDEGEPVRAYMEMPHDVYRDMGEPPVVTVTVVAGDRLNDE